MALSVYATPILKQLLRLADLGLLSCRSAHCPLSVSKDSRLVAGAVDGPGNRSRADTGTVTCAVPPFRVPVSISCGRRPQVLSA